MTGCVVFDLDGTLVDSVPMISGLLAAMLAERGETAPLGYAEVRPHVTAGGPAMIEALLRGRCGGTDEALAEFRARYAAAPTPMESVFPGARRALQALAAAGFGLAVFSNKPQNLCEKVLADVALADLFGAIVGTGPGAPLKPDPAGYHLALARCCGTPRASCLVGDSEADVMVARAAGAPLVLAAWGYGGPELRQHAAAVAERFDEVPALAAQAVSRRETA